MRENELRVKRVVAVSSYLPFPLDRGDPVRVDMYLRALNEVGDLTVLVTEREDTTPQHIEELKNRLPSAKIFTFPPARNKATRRLAATRWVLSVARLTPSWIANRHSSGISTFLRTHGKEFDICFLIGEAAGQYASHVHAKTVHWDKSNVLAASTVGDMEESQPRSVTWIRKAVIAKLSRYYEHRVLQVVDQVSVTSALEAVRLKKFHQANADFIHSSAVQPASAVVKTNPNSTVVLWMGSFQYHSNTNGLQRFIAEGLPILRSHGYTLRVVGSGADPVLASRLQSTPGIEFQGFVPDLTDAVEGVKAAVIPLWSGAGVKIKTLTLMGLGLPVAGTEVAFEGIRHTAALGLTESAVEMARLCVEASPDDLSDARERALEELIETFSETQFFARVNNQLLKQQ